MQLKNKVAVVTGAGSGIGKATALRLAKEGCRLALNDVSEANLAVTSNEITDTFGTEIFVRNFDVSDWTAMQGFATEVTDHFGHADLVINNAGVALGSFSLEEVTIKDFEWLMGINFWGMVYGSKAFLPTLRSRKESCLVNISSILGLLAIGKQSPYCASKFAIRGFTESIRMEAMMDYPHVNVLSVHPGGIKTNIAKNSKWDSSAFSEEQKKAMKEEFEKSFINTPEYAANVIVKGILKNKKRVLIGKDARTMWRIARWFPVNYTKIMIRTFMQKYNLEAKKIIDPQAGHDHPS